MDEDTVKFRLKIGVNNHIDAQFLLSACETLLSFSLLPSLQFVDSIRNCNYLVLAKSSSCVCNLALILEVVLHHVV